MEVWVLEHSNGLRAHSPRGLSVVSIPPCGDQSHRLAKGPCLNQIFFPLAGRLPQTLPSSAEGPDPQKHYYHHPQYHAQMTN